MEKSARVIVTAFVQDIWGRGELDLIDEWVHPEYRADGSAMGRNSVRKNVARFHAAFPDLSIELVELIDRDNRVAVLIEFSGTHCGAFGGIQATGRTVRFREAGFFKVEEGMVVEGSFVVDGLGLRIQLGILPESFWTNPQR